MCPEYMLPCWQCFMIFMIISSLPHSATAPSFAYVNSPAALTEVQRTLTSHLQCHDIHCIHFSFCSLIAATAPRLLLPQLLLADRVRFSCCFPISSSSAAASQSRLLCLQLCPLQLLLSGCVCLQPQPFLNVPAPDQRSRPFFV